MLPIVLQPQNVLIGLAAAGQGGLRRLRALREAGVDAAIFADDPALASLPGAQTLAGAMTALAGLRLLYIVGLEAEHYVPLAKAARAARVLVNVEDVPEFCDFHNVAEVRRGDLLLTISTGGAAPGLAGAIRRALDSCFAPAWAGRVAEISSLRTQWRAQGVPMAEAAARIEALARENCWLNCPGAPPIRHK